MWGLIDLSESGLGVEETTLRREINPTVYPPSEYAPKLKAKNHFLTSVLRGEKIFVIGDEHEPRILG